MPEQLTKHPDVTLQVLRSAGARCGEGVSPKILTHCPVERFCQLPGGELCVYGLPEAMQMTQITAAQWHALVPGPAPASSAASGVDWADAGWGLVAGLVVGAGVARLARHGRR